jgi:hypothetical protein
MADKEVLYVARNLEAVVITGVGVGTASILPEALWMGLPPSLRDFYRFTPDLFAWVLWQVGRLEDRWVGSRAAAGANRAANRASDNEAALRSQLTQAAERLEGLWEWADGHFGPGELEEARGRFRPGWKLPVPGIDRDGLDELINRKGWFDRMPEPVVGFGLGVTRKRKATESAKKVGSRVRRKKESVVAVDAMFGEGA